MRRFGFVILIVFVATFMAAVSAMAQTTSAPTTTPGAPAVGAPTTGTPIPGTTAPQSPSLFKFNMPVPPRPTPGVFYAFDLCHGVAVRIAGGNNPDLNAFKADIDQKQCGGSFEQNPRISGTDSPVHFELGSGGFPPLGMHLGLNGVLYGTPKPHGRLFKPQPFKICAVTLGGYQDCHEVAFENAPAARRNNGARVALLAGGAGAAAIGVGVAMRGSSSSSSGGSCGTPPANIYDDCFSHPQSPNCPTDIQQYDAFCKCNGFAGGFNVNTGGCQQ